MLENAVCEMASILSQPQYVNLVITLITSSYWVSESKYWLLNFNSTVTAFKYWEWSYHDFNRNMRLMSLTHLPLLLHICITDMSQHWFRYWLITWMVPNHYLNQYWHIINYTPRNIFQWNFILNSSVFIHEDAFEHTLCKMAASWINYYFIYRYIHVSVSCITYLVANALLNIHKKTVLQINTYIQ